MKLNPEAKGLRHIEVQRNLMFNRYEAGGQSGGQTEEVFDRGIHLCTLLKLLGITL